MSDSRNNTPENEHYDSSFSGDTQTDYYDDEELPTAVLIAAAAIAILTATLYLWLGGGHNHFH
jgi:hypothetical protein